ncbi:MAG: FtsW/RodA/SpoVE family cell cycle protein [Treponema sp.]|nr:FtsW/RodA/SpoVE family cell cycle protein [Treponema sp.]
MAKKQTKTRIDHIFLGSIILLSGMGLITLYSSAPGFIEDQLIYSGVGFLFLAITAVFPLDMLRDKRIVAAGFVVVLGAGILTRIPGIGTTINGASRWIRIGSKTFQPSELMKLFLPFYLAHMLDRKKRGAGEAFENFWRSILPLFIVTALFIIVIGMQNNFSTAGFIAVNMTLIFIMAGIKLRYLIGALIVILTAGSVFILMSPHRLNRIYAFFVRDDIQDAAFQIDKAVSAIKAGGFWGKGFEQGDFSLIPEVHSDFIFCAYAEEFGFLGVLLYFFLMGVFMAEGYLIAFKTLDMYRRFMAFGYITIIVSQVFFNIAVSVGVIPTTGIPLPFFSAGGTSLISTLIMCGVLVNISRASQNLNLLYNSKRR